MNASMQLERKQMESCHTRLAYRRTESARGLRRALRRLGGLVIALVIVSLICVGAQWLFVDAAASAVELGVAVRAAADGN